MRCFYESSDYESFLRNVFSLECDSDTFGAIAGGVAEEFYGGFGGVDADGILKKYLNELPASVDSDVAGQLDALIVEEAFDLSNEEYKQKVTKYINKMIKI